ncbi:HAD domain-containing protein [Cupriavidus oxalaticus]|uniref:HAD domain-containing protein n=1 Tax=Cupriavidus oxalaticus TaxID=96344 RepID=UPI0040334A38
MIVFLDYDGVLHPDAAYLVNGRPELHADGTLFMWAPILEKVLEPYPQVRIVLSTSWVRALRSFSRARSYLPVALQTRVIGATWHSAMSRHHEGAHRVDASWFTELSRYAQIARYISRAGFRAEHWLAIDDDSEDWPAELRDHLIETDGARGLASESAQAELALRLQRMVAETLLGS